MNMGHGAENGNGGRTWINCEQLRGGKNKLMMDSCGSLRGAKINAQLQNLVMGVGRRKRNSLNCSWSDHAKRTHETWF